MTATSKSLCDRSNLILPVAEYTQEVDIYPRHFSNSLINQGEN